MSAVLFWVSIIAWVLFYFLSVHRRGRKGEGWAILGMAASLLAAWWVYLKPAVAALAVAVLVTGCQGGVDLSANRRGAAQALQEAMRTCGTNTVEYGMNMGNTEGANEFTMRCTTLISPTPERE